MEPPDDFAQIRDELARLFPDYPTALRPRAAFQWFADRTELALGRMDFAEVLKALQFAQFMSERREARRLEIGVASAWRQAWSPVLTEQNEAIIIALAEQLPGAERNALWLPFERPHHWLRTRILSRGEFSITSTLRAPVERQESYIRQSGPPGHFARITLRFDFDPGSGVVTFRNRLPEEFKAGLEYIYGVIDGLERALAELRAGGRDLADVMIELQALEHHPVDSRRTSYAVAAHMAFNFAIREAGLKPVM